jgi:uncharacterized membrane protein YbaN (DUF454 family)
MNRASAPKPTVVHSSVGRLRIHRPDPDGYLSACIRRLPGVKSVEASELTGNILILYHPRQTNEQTLLTELSTLGADEPPPVPARRAVTRPAASAPRPAAPVLRVEPTPANGYVTGPTQSLYKVLGWSSVGLAVVGAVTPGIPTAPFVLVAGYFFIRSSPAAHEWLLRSRWFGPFLRDWEERRGVKRSVKYAAVGLMGAGLVFTWLVGLPPAVLASILALEAVGLVIVLRLPVVDEPPSPTPVSV